MRRASSKGFGNLLQSLVPDVLHPGGKLLCFSGCKQLQILPVGSHHNRIPHDGIAMLLCSIERTCRRIDERSAGFQLAFFVDHHQKVILCQRLSLNQFNPVAANGFPRDIKHFPFRIARDDSHILRFGEQDGILLFIQTLRLLIFPCPVLFSSHL